MATIRDVARISGYSISTVSRVLNNKNYVSDGVRTKIQQVMDDLDYVPSDMARDLSRGKTMNIGVVSLNVDHPYYLDMTAGIMTAAFAAGYNLLMLPSRYKNDEERGYLEQLRRKAFDGLIFTTHNIPISEMLHYQKYGRIVICHDPGDEPILASYSDRGPSYMQAFTWIHRRHFKNVGLLLPRDPALSATAHETIAAYTRVFGQQPDRRMMRYDTMTYADGYAAAEYFISNGLNPDFIMANGDDIATGFAQYYKEHHLRVPGLMGQDQQLSGQLMGFPTIDHHYKDVGAAALRLAIGAADESVGIHSDFIAERK
ncbi:LacI family DNA-binding transcriptional regulator [Lacticaseibacillus pabuli]|uniref:LacI family DNA-binding transcriptional regulator n=1 Tax=Lacticaseibacillus pabuli TaxID=3025672 RepID=A0ABY7WXQ4_9LACO|nr:LacI family DNA-binding transcriptional regulator [Lacticaseibacillus sp. KACC 23028]WDF82720.1 LacI family DNA-binding transcriptional regulator [Lacticaseibacillus sp. KACC 23028]